MKKIIKYVPKGIKFLSDWKDFSLPDHPCIIDKKITGCGFTEWAITSNLNIILCSPRKILLQNKADQHKKDLNVLYAKNQFVDISLEVDKDISKDDDKSDKSPYFPKKPTEKMLLKKKLEDQARIDALVKFKESIRKHWESCQPNPFTRKDPIPCKIMVTYDSFRKVKETLQELGVFDKFYIVIDECQSIFTDSRFKSTTEMEFVGHLQDNSKICYVSATPMLEEYLNRVDEFKDLPYIELDWEKEDPNRVTHPLIEPHSCTKMTDKIMEIIDKYRNKKFKDCDLFKYIDSSGKPAIKEPEHAVFYFNSVVSLCKIIKKANLTYEDCNVLCAETDENEKKVKQAFGGSKKIRSKYIGSVPLPDEEWKLFTFCTRTVYLGADFYSDSAMSYIFSDANIDCLSVDISIDLPQILGRMRNDNNPWKNKAIIYFNPIYQSGKVLENNFKLYLDDKIKKTNYILSAWNKCTGEEQGAVLSNYKLGIRVRHYREDYIAINEHAGSSPVAVFNNLVFIAEQRAFDIQQLDYADRCTVFNTIESKFNTGITSEIKDYLEQFNNLITFCDKMKFICELNLKSSEIDLFLSRVIPIYGNYYNTIGPARIKALGYKRKNLEREFNNLIIESNDVELSNKIYDKFKENDKITRLELKAEIQSIYDMLNYKKVAKAQDIAEWFEIKPALITDPTSKKRINGFELLKRLK